ncbi:(2Fe-2S)-binding protein [Algoriphagus boritolerans]|uniref:Nicotinate dehydrogenase subunit A n=1 Tax=Algoriphagus boritolerans DSM 17298 = JCM 18970 TaxID=1120964 RepID=A0A1H5ZNU3_9BACT|nr:(2Fe-2S)-binding protein [Algoriphagus boritolerans]SEG38188.1 nicotinate dehydrogenase subunit A [Algoriphagus boritolerans DSM 17298 = JCM 18970]
MEPIKLNVNSENKSFSTDPSEPLLYILREEFGINSTKFGCGLQQCGACMVLLDGEAEPSCLLSCQSAQSKSIVTLEGLEKDGKLHPIQEAFIEAQAAQCGYCINGMIISAVALLRKNPNPSDKEIREALQRVICRCGTHSRFIQAVKIAAESTQPF